MHSPPKNRCQGWKRRIKSATMAKKLLFFPFPSPPYHAPARAPRLAAAQLLFSVEIGSKPPRIAEARSSNKERSWVQVFYRIVEFAANIGGLNINAEL
ncbi:hypothetical protein PVAP13_7KG031527 [Panicum virgatum]|uniref:Uncharacterized protein n=1 Tax=Panicum virgatum TaxID=38727 RepID=A0A8T0QHH2_PANVG|nr:hypothetical protein PVAP13_7NG111457 [Panicum virgatum]KAG2570166.1 hypothetical protein PVAP13_7KG031527 [Panicum virgatum]